MLDGLSTSLNNLAVSEGFRGSAAQRTRLFRKALEFSRTALRVHPNDDDLLRGISILTSHLARDLWEQGNREEAVEEMRGVIALLEQKVRANPEVTGPVYGYRPAAKGFEYLPNVQKDREDGPYGYLTAAQGLAYWLKESGRMDEAAGVLRQAFALAETLAREHPAAAAARRFFIDAAYDAAAGFEDLKRPDEAIRYLMTGRAALDRVPRETGDSLVEDASSRLKFAELMARCKPELAAEERAEREGLLDQAMASLRRAAAAGWRDAAKLKAEAIYGPIRGRLDYPALLAALEAAATAPAPVAAGLPADLDRLKSAAAVAKSPEIRLARASILAAIGQVQAAVGHGAKGLEYLRQAIPLQQQLVAEKPADVDRRVELAGIHLSFGKTLDDLGQMDSAIAPLEAARRLYEALGDVSREKTEFRSELGATFMALGRAYSNSGRRAESLAAWDRAHKELTLAIEEKPDDPQRWIDRALFFIRRRQESLAASDLGRAWSLDPGAEGWSRPVLWAALVLFSGDREEYCRGCRRLLERFGQTNDATSRLYLAITLGLGEDAVDDWRRIVRITQDAVDEFSLKGPYLYHDLALVCLRAGQFEAALRALDDSDRLGSSWPAHTLNNPVRAIVCHRLSRHTEARSALNKARHWADQNEKKGPPDLTDLNFVGDWYRHLILLREAEALIVYDPIFPADPFAR